ncbi:sigma factor-like helix-turn-helix DNA-binding protein [Bacillus sp. CGMCC 1.16541]|uniref:sigma factor-like helix-turn-helix DNA-binding protein n=1 Tax=Bacillus sp. CGMCC 1.16541 TaxID=2185143 RepID=UPI000D73D0A6|nr:sigma factor-like helix-turn-helix DNA-binding protein [Bacillus sp. CGMCC 1.16541]
MKEHTLLSFLQKADEELASVGRSIDEHIFHDPHATLMKGRLFGELVAKLVFQQENIDEYYPMKHVERIHKLDRDGLIDHKIKERFNWLRVNGNKAAHEADYGTIEQSLTAHRFVYDLGVWYMESYGSLDFNAPTYEIPKPAKGQAVNQNELNELLTKTVEKTLQELLSAQLGGLEKTLLEKIGQKEVATTVEEQEEEVPEIENDVHDPVENPESNSDSFQLVDYLLSHNLEVIDKRANNGALWVVGGWELNNILFPLKKHRIYFRFSEKGGKATRKRPSWFLIGNYAEKPSVRSEDQSPEGTEETLLNSETETEIAIESKVDKTAIEVDLIIEDQLVIPARLIEVEIITFSAPVLQEYAQQFQVSTFKQVSLADLRHIYRRNRETFSKLLVQLWFLGVSFQGGLYQLVKLSHNQLETLCLQNESSQRLPAQLPDYVKGLLKTFGIETMKQLSYVPVASLKWILDKEYDTLVRLVQEEGTSGEIIQGCNNLVMGLKEKLNVHTYGEIPENLEVLKDRIPYVGPRMLEKFFDQLVEVCGENLQEIDDNSQGSTKGEIVSFNGEQCELPETIKGMAIEVEDYPSCPTIVEKLHHHGIASYGDLPIDLTDLKKLPSVGNKAVEKFFTHVKQKVMQVEELVKEEELLQSMNEEELIQYEFTRFATKLAHAEQHNAFDDMFRLDDRTIAILRQRYKGWLKGNRPTLEDLGQMHGVTRERIRQIIQKASIKLSQVGRRWFERLEQALREHQGVLDNTFFTNRSFTDYMMIETLEELDIRLDVNQKVITSKTRQEIIDDLQMISKHVEEKYCRKLVQRDHFTDVVNEVIAFVQLPNVLVTHVMEDAFILSVNEQHYFLASSKKIDIAAMTLEQFPEGIEVYKEWKKLNELANELIPGLFVGERDFPGICNRDEFVDTVYLWGRGTYIHEKFVNPPFELLQKIREKMLTDLEKRPVLSIGSSYHRFQELLKEQGVPTEYALYTLLRTYHADALSLPKFPKVMKVGDDRSILNVDILKDFLRHREHPVTIKELKEEFIQKRGWKSFTLDVTLFHSKDVIQTDLGVHTLLERFDHVTVEILSPIIQTIKERLNDWPSIQITGIFKEHEPYCKANRIPTHYVLYSLLKDRVGDQFQLHRFPHIVRLGEEADSVTVRSLMENYLLEMGCEVSREEMLDWLQNEIGAREQMFDSMLPACEKIYYYTRGQFAEFLHEDVLGWNEEKAAELTRYINEALQSQLAKNGQPFIVVTDYLHEDRLPSLEIDLPWTSDLLIDCLKRNNEFQLFGSKSYIIMKSENDLGIETNSDFITYLLESEFDGACKIKEFKKRLVEVLYSKEGRLLHEVETLLDENNAPFVKVGDEYMLKSLLEGVNA